MDRENWAVTSHGIFVFNNGGGRIEIMSLIAHLEIVQSTNIINKRGHNKIILFPRYVVPSSVTIS